MKTSELTGVALDWAVAKAEGLQAKDIDGVLWLLDTRGAPSRSFNPSTNWACGGPIMERNWIGFDSPLGEPLSQWLARRGRKHAWGDTPLIAAMRCHVASRLGDEVDIPKDCHEDITMPLRPPSLQASEPRMALPLL